MQSEKKSDSFQLYPLIATTCFQNGMIEEGDKLMNILREKNNRFFQHVAGIVADYRKKANLFYLPTSSHIEFV